MFNKLLMWLFRKRLKKLSPEDKQRVRELVANKKQETKSDTTEKKQKTKKTKKENQKMAEEVKETEKVETKENTSAEKDNATKPVVEEKETEKTDKKEVEEGNETETADEVKTTDQVAEVEESGNGRDINDYALKDDVMQLIQALNAKIDAVVKENGDLKEKLAGKDDELNGMREKYETKDFGNTQRQGVMTKDKDANDTFEEYAKSFM